MIQIFNPSRLTRQPFFGELIRYLDQHEDVIFKGNQGSISRCSS
ncbi:hypothetical protein SMIDD26_01172 [Streptococcus mitis]|uniref:Uncharacterized protein n=1 Tax=Streptococcus mitis TaxID=28037 RepID=A0A139PQN3_STRMT|nr:hypothetical protein SMIDD26_01172 [Streptococcus mitis]